MNPRDTMVYAVSHGRDGLSDLWPKLFNDLRYTYAYRRFASFSTGLGTHLVEKAGLRGVPNTDGMAQITLTGLTSIGSASLCLPIRG